MPAGIVADRAGLSSNSYATVDEADLYVDDIFGAESWAELAAEDKTRLLLTATRMIDRLSIRFDPEDPAQRLRFPVKGASEDGFARVKEAAIIQALYLSENLDAIKEAEQGSIQGLKSEGLGPTSKTATGFNRTRLYDRQVYQLLSPFIQFGLSLRRG